MIASKLENPHRLHVDWIMGLILAPAPQNHVRPLPILTFKRQPQVEVPVVVQLRDKLTDLVQLLGSSGVLLSQTQSQANLVLGSGQHVSRGAELHIPCHSRNTNPLTAETSASFCIQYPGKARDFHYNPGVD